MKAQGRRGEKPSRRGQRHITASELATFVYCRRAWWLRHVGGHDPSDPSRLRLGRAGHRAHGQRVAWAQRAVIVGRILVAAGVMLALMSLWQALG
ncbi:MAG: hypothetical protein Q9O62_13325 [Ardenticatenia bacterium]|nr:hypothetical protein [Ardenticatenia bacterium]